MKTNETDCVPRLVQLSIWIARHATVTTRSESITLDTKFRGSIDRHVLLERLNHCPFTDQSRSETHTNDLNKRENAPLRSPCLSSRFLHLLVANTDLIFQPWGNNDVIVFCLTFIIHCGSWEDKFCKTWLFYSNDPEASINHGWEEYRRFCYFHIKFSYAEIKWKKTYFRKKARARIIAWKRRMLYYLHFLLYNRKWR